jgi:hypothetical protein
LDWENCLLFLFGYGVLLIVVSGVKKVLNKNVRKKVFK